MKSRNSFSKLTAAIEGLETRSLMSAVAVSDGILTVTGEADTRNVLRVEYFGGRNVIAIANEVVQTFPRADVKFIRIDGGSADDRINVSRSLAIPTRIVGGGGDDIVLGGAGRDILYGGDGNDILNGRAERDTLFGGAGEDSLQGSVIQDQLFQGDEVATEVPDYPVNVYPGTGVTINVATVGAVGDGVTDNWYQVQHAIDLALPGTTIYFPSGVYKISNTINIHKPLTVTSDNATILFGGNQLGGFRHFTVAGPDGWNNPGVEWREEIDAGTSTLDVSLPAARFKAGDPIYMWLGHDPFDPGLPHYSGIHHIVAMTGDTVTLDRPIPYDVIQGQRVHKIFPMPKGILHDVTIRDLRLDQVDGAILDMNISVERARNVKIENISGRVANMVNVADSADVSVNNVDVDMLTNHNASGRVLTVWQSDRVRLTNVRARTNGDMPLVFLESWARNTTIDNLDVTWGFKNYPTNGVVHLTGGSYGTVVDDLVVRNAGAGPILLVGNGGQDSEYRFGAVEVTGPIASLPVNKTERLTIAGRVYSEIGTSRHQMTLKPNTAQKMVIHSGGLIRNITMSITGKTGVRNVYLLNAANQGDDLLPLLKPGQVLTVPGVGGVGIKHTFNDLGGSEKTVGVLTGADLPAGTVLTVTVEYYN